MKRCFLALCGAFFLFAGLPAYAQGIISIRPVAACGSTSPFPAFVAAGNGYGFLLQDLNGNLCTSGSSSGGTTTAPTFVAPSIGAATDRSGSITTGGTAQQITGPNTARKRLIVQNPCSATTQNIAATENLYVRYTTGNASASGGSFELLPCSTFDTGPGPVASAAVTVFAATTAHRFTATEQ